MSLIAQLAGQLGVHSNKGFVESIELFFINMTFLCSPGIHSHVISFHIVSLLWQKQYVRTGWIEGCGVGNRILYIEKTKQSD